jgi:fumarate reductase subunit C
MSQSVLPPGVEQPGSPGYTPHHPRWYRPRVSTYWWLQRWSYLAFILRELSSVFVAWFVVFLLLLVAAVSGGEASYRQFLAWAGRPVVLLLNLVSLFFVVFHAVTWFNLAPQALVVRLGGKRVPGQWIAVSNYAAWALASVLVLWLLLGG